MIIFDCKLVAGNYHNKIMYNLLNVKLSKHISRNYTLKCIFSFYEEYKGGREENPQSVN